MATKFLASIGARISDEDAEVIGIRLTELTEGGQPITPEMVVENAIPETSPIHEYFEWDNEKAGGRYRILQARYYLRSIEVVIQEQEAPVRAFHVVTLGEERGYLPVQVVIGNIDLMEQVMEAARRELSAWQRRYRQYKELAKPVELVEQAIQQLAA